VRVTTSPPKIAARIPKLLWGPDALLYVGWEAWDRTMGVTRIAKRVESKTVRFEGRER
jgi:hypothetical protein